MLCILFPWDLYIFFDVCLLGSFLKQTLASCDSSHLFKGLVVKPKDMLYLGDEFVTLNPIILLYSPLPKMLAKERPRFERPETQVAQSDLGI